MGTLVRNRRATSVQWRRPVVGGFRLSYMSDVTPPKGGWDVGSGVLQSTFGLHEPLIYRQWHLGQRRRCVICETIRTEGGKSGWCAECIKRSKGAA